MLTAAAFASAVALLAASVTGHGYMLIPESQFSGSATSAWIVQIDPVWPSNGWDGNNEGSVTTFNSLKSSHNYVNLKTLMDDTSTYGADCGFTNPSGTAQPIPSDGKAKFSRAMQHVGPCEIWLDSKNAFTSDNCVNMETFDVDYSSCKSGGCKEMRFYWLAFQGLDGKTVWQSYKDCIPLEGSGGGGTSQTSTSSQTPTSGGNFNTPSSGDSNTPSSGDTKSPSSGNTPSSGDSNNSPSSGDSKTPWTGGWNNSPTSGTSNNNPSSGDSNNTPPSGSWGGWSNGNSATQAPTSSDTPSSKSNSPSSGKSENSPSSNNWGGWSNGDSVNQAPTSGSVAGEADVQTTYSTPSSRCTGRRRFRK